MGMSGCSAGDELWLVREMGNTLDSATPQGLELERMRD